jgi:hypothetical protein
MSLAALLAFLNANQATIATILLIISEALGANPKVKANGIVSFILLQLQAKLKERGAIDPTP